MQPPATSRAHFHIHKSIRRTSKPMNADRSFGDLQGHYKEGVSLHLLNRPLEALFHFLEARITSITGG